jgi:hypothetical protein
MLAGGAVRLTARVADAHDALNQTDGSTALHEPQESISAVRTGQRALGVRGVRAPRTPPAQFATTVR